MKFSQLFTESSAEDFHNELKKKISERGGYSEGDKVRYLYGDETHDGLVESQNEKLNHFHETDKTDESYQEYKDSMMKKHGYTDWGKASKDKKFMNALDRGWNGEDEEGKDGVNEGVTWNETKIKPNKTSLWKAYHRKSGVVYNVVPGLFTDKDFTISAFQDDDWKRFEILHGAELVKNGDWVLFKTRSENEGPMLKTLQALDPSIKIIKKALRTPPPKERYVRELED